MAERADLQRCGRARQRVTAAEAWSASQATARVQHRRLGSLQVWQVAGLDGLEPKDAQDPTSG
jgi:hypothetical protein